MCVFTDKRYSKYTALVLVPLLAINTYVGYTLVAKSTNEDNIGLEDVPVLEDVMAESYTDQIREKYGTLEETDNKIIGTHSFTELLNIVNSSDMSIQEILDKEEKDSILYVSALYAKLKSFSIQYDIILRELENIVCFGTQATCVSEELWLSSFDNLLGTISEFDNVIDYYYPLASYVHLQGCNLEHDSLFFDDKRITCSKLEELLQNKIPTFDYKSYIVEMVNATDDIEMIILFNKLLDSGINLDDILNELECVYQLSIIPTDLPEDLWISLFGNLMTTIKPEENVCTVYYDLSYYVHSLWCDLEHSLNEYGKYECNDYLLILEK